MSDQEYVTTLFLSQMSEYSTVMFMGQEDIDHPDNKESGITVPGYYYWSEPKGKWYGPYKTREEAKELNTEHSPIFLVSQKDIDCSNNDISGITIPGYYFWNEVWDDCHGPYTSYEEVKLSFEKYCKNIAGI